MFAPFPLEFYLIIKLAPKFKDFQGLEFLFKIQGFLRTFKVCANTV